MNIFLKYILISFFIIYSVKSQTPVYYPGFPKIIDTLRSPNIGGGFPLITDLENDGQKEIIFALSGSSPPFMLYVIKSDGEILSGFPKGYDMAIRSIASGDVNGDGFLDIALRFVNSVDVIDRFGNSLSGFPRLYNDDDVSPTKLISLYDLNNDGKLEIIVNRFNEICVFNFNGDIRNGWPKQVIGQASMNPAIGNIDNTGDAEIIIATYKQLSVYPWLDSSALRIFESDGSLFSKNWPVYYDSLYGNWRASPSLIINRNNIDSNFILMSSLSPPDNSGFRMNRITKYNIKGEIMNQTYRGTFNGLGT